ncbi:MAG: YwqG family protein [Anaerolineae bacterium]
MNKTEIEQLLLKHGLERVADPLLALARPAIRIHTLPADDSAMPLGASKWGLPHLPPDIEWPEALDFIGQFNLADIHPLVHEHWLPETGMLSIFYGTQSHQHRIENCRIGYWDVDPQQLVQHTQPKGMTFPACSLQFTEAWTLPGCEAVELQALNLTTAEYLAYVEIDPSINAGDDGEQQLLGHGYYLDSTPFLAASGRESAWMTSEPHQRMAIEREISTLWLNLLQMQNAPHLNMEWLDSGIAHFSIEREALRQGDFSRVWVDVDFI